jgi:hypothetical protein
LNSRLVRQGILPADCPYVQGIKDYPAPHMWDEEESEDQ